jgi:biotin carboxyl carrier protein
MYLTLEQAVFVGGKHRLVRLAKTDRPTFFLADIDGKRYGLELTSKLAKDNPSFTMKIDGKQYKINVSQNKNHSIIVQVDGRSFTIKSEKIREPPKIKTAPTVAMRETVLKPPVEEGAIIASMPGKVVAVKVKRGDYVNAGSVLCILEAMKMENEIVASKTGTVQEINVSEGATVNRGQVLMVLK